jgi:hypothetical protein
LINRGKVCQVKCDRFGPTVRIIAGTWNLARAAKARQEASLRAPKVEAVKKESSDLVNQKKDWEGSLALITFLTIQRNHNAWVKSFFDEEKGTSYKGTWTGDDVILPAIRLKTREGR